MHWFANRVWNNFMHHKARRTKGKVSKLYTLFGKFEKDDIEVFFNAFTEKLPQQKLITRVLK